VSKLSSFVQKGRTKVAIFATPLSKALGAYTKSKTVKKILEHPIISAIIASLVVSFLGWLFGLFPVVWESLAVSSTKLVLFMTVTFEVPLWLILIVTLPIIWIVARIEISNFKRSKIVQNREKDENTIREKHSDLLTKKEVPLPEPHELSDEEKRVLKLIIAKDGNALEYKDIKYRLKIPKLQAEQIIEALSEFGITEVFDNHFHGPQIYLTNKGRDYVIGNKYTRT
jgi:hypothetical protein